MSGTMMLEVDKEYIRFRQYLSSLQLQKIMIVCTQSARKQKLFSYLKTSGNTVLFNDFHPNPDYLEVWRGIQLFNSKGCDGILAIGGGSAIDVAKCIKLFADASSSRFFEYKIVPNKIPFVAVPTTAGSGSEATRFAVIYCNGEKLSISDCSCIPQAVLLDPTVLNSLPMYTKKSAMLDALCHGIESIWSVNATCESKEFAAAAIRLIINNMEAYITGDNSKNILMLQAANLAGKAINISQTTAGHAMSYKLTGLYGISHGHAVALCVAELMNYTAEHGIWCVDAGNEENFDTTLNEIATAMGCMSFKEAAKKFVKIIQRLELPGPDNVDDADYDLLTASVNRVRLKNHPIELDAKTIRQMYHNILR